MRPAGRARVALPHAVRVAMRECILRGAARNYTEACGAPDEEESAAELGDAAVDYAVALLQNAGAREAARTAVKRGPKGKKGKGSS